MTIPNKKYFRISEVAELVGVKMCTLRSWGRFPWLRAKRSRGGQRMYSRRQVERLLEHVGAT
jgi:DNA-binding transcriptional MerR regulator